MGLYSHSASKRQPRPGPSSQSLYISDYVGGVLLSRAVPTPWADAQMRFEVHQLARSFDSRTRLITGPAGLRFEAPTLWVRTLRGRSVICPIFGQITLRPLSVRTAVGDARTSAVGSAGASASGAGPRESTGHANQSERIKASEPKARNAQSSSSAFRASRRFPREGAGWRTRGLLHGERRRKRFCPAMQLCWRARPLRSRRRARS